MEKKVKFAILHYIVERGVLLTQTEIFLDSFDEHELSSQLRKLIEDCGLQLFNDIGQPDSDSKDADDELSAINEGIEGLDPKDLPNTMRLLQERHGISYERLTVLDQVEDWLVLHNAPMAKVYSEMMSTYRGLLPVSELRPKGGPAKGFTLH